MNSLVNILSKSGLLSEDLEYHLLRASMVIRRDFRIVRDN